MTSVVSCRLCRGAGHEIKLLLVISVQLLPPWPLVVCVPERDIRPLSECVLPVCVRERARCSMSGPLHQTALFWIEFYYRASSCQSQPLDWHTHTLNFQQGCHWTRSKLCHPIVSVSKQEVTAQCPSSAHGLTYAHAARMGDEWLADLKSGDVTEEFKCQPYAKNTHRGAEWGGYISVRDLIGLLTPSVKLRPFELLKLLPLLLSLSLFANPRSLMPALIL